MNNKLEIMQEAKKYVEHITSINNTTAFLRGFIAGLKHITIEEELDSLIAFDLDVENFKAGYFDGLKIFSEQNEEKITATLYFANLEMSDKIVDKVSTPIQSLFSNLNNIINAQYIDIQSINKDSLNNLTEINKQLYDKTTKLNENIETLPLTNKSSIDNYNDELDKLLNEAIKK